MSRPGRALIFFLIEIPLTATPSINSTPLRKKYNIFH